MIPVTNFAALVGKSSTAGGGLKGVVQFLPIQEVAQTLVGLYQARDNAKNVLYEVSGIADVLRGQVDPREKLGQSQIKASFASQRLEQRRRAVERVARDAARIQVELMAELYPSLTLREQSGFDQMREVTEMDEQQRSMLWEQIHGLIKEDRARGFRIDVETDSTVEMDAGQTREARNEFLASAGAFLKDVIPVMQVAPSFAPVMGEMLLFAVRGYRAGRTLESAFEEAVQDIKDQVEQAAQQPQQEGPPPDPKAEAEAARTQQQMQIDGASAQIELQAQQQKAAIEAEKGAAELEKTVAEVQKQLLESEEARLDVETKNVKLQQEIQKLIQGPRQPSNSR